MYQLRLCYEIIKDFCETISFEIETISKKFPKWKDVDKKTIFNDLTNNDYDDHFISNIFLSVYTEDLYGNFEHCFNLPSYEFEYFDNVEKIITIANSKVDQYDLSGKCSNF